jgi:hypothetical protein
VTKTIVAGALAAALASNAPLQCGHKPDPDVRVEEAGDALWDLAMQLRAQGNEEGARQTLRYLVEKYPSNRHVPAAKADLAGSPPAPAPSAMSERGDGGT